MSDRAIVEQSSFSLPRMSGLPQDHAVNLAIRDLELEFERTFDLMGRGASRPTDLPELADVLLSLEVHTPNFTSLMFDEYVRRQVDRNAVSGSLNLIEAEVWHTMRRLEDLVSSSRDTIEQCARAAEVGIDALGQLSTRDSVSTVSAAILELEGYLEDLRRVRDWTLQTVARFARAIEDWIAKVGTLAQIPGADGRLSSRGREVAEEYRRHFGTVRGYEFDILQADGKVVPRWLNLLEADVDKAVAFGFEKFGGVQLGERHDIAWMRRYVSANLEKWQRQHGLGAVVVEMRHHDQKLLDNYNGDQAKLLEDLLQGGYYTAYDVAETQTFRDLIHEARRLNIPIIAIDSPYSVARAVDPNFNDPYGRMRTSDPYWVATYRQVRESLAPETPVLVLAGGNHSSFGAHIGIPTIDDKYSEVPDMERSLGQQLWESDPGTLAHEPGTRAWPEPEHKETYTEQEFIRYMQDSETFIGMHDGATIVVNPPNPATR